MFCLHIKSDIPIDIAWEQLEAGGLSVAYSEEDNENRKLYIFSHSDELLGNFEWIESYHPYDLPPINWDAQWQLHGVNFKEGLSHIELSQFGNYDSTLRLKPGPGFGDLSHPTTRLVLHLIPKYLHNQSVIDLGCGSGILSLAAVAMGAPQAYGIDIDSQALQHSKENAEINRLEKKCHFTQPAQVPKIDTAKEWLILINMIFSEQQVAWNSLTLLHALPGKLLTSGIRLAERDLYLEQAKEWGWRLIEEIREEEWLGFCFESL